MKPTDFSKYLSGFLTGYLAHERGAYRDTFILFIGYMAAQGTPVNRLTPEAITQRAVVSFLDWLRRSVYQSLIWKYPTDKFGVTFLQRHQ